MLLKFLPFIALFFFVACEKSPDIQSSEGCDEDILTQLDYVSPTGEVDLTGPGCVDYLNKLRSSDGTFYYALECNCCDMPLKLYNCDGQFMCDGRGDCPGIVMDAEVIRIVGVKE